MYTPSGESAAHRVVGFAISVSAEAADGEYHFLDLVQHTPKVEEEPTRNIDKIRLEPKALKPSPQRDEGPWMRTGQSYIHEGGHGSIGQELYPTEHTFERVQFQPTTADHGGRQQYFRLVVQLYADIGTGFTMIASRKSEKLIVLASPVPGQLSNDATQERWFSF
ncbi:hypothetical protein F4803DRAFT_500269 [Xylaria telfairii]|nr:hypothetical protein F4803DRAFT_500269 [Xylaria telfairii]